MSYLFSFLLLCFAQTPTVLEMKWKETNAKAFEAHTVDYNKSLRKHPEMGVDSAGYIPLLGLMMDHQCDQICETFLVDTATNTSLYLPSNYDQGLMGFLISPSRKWVVLYSSYDGPDYVNYYDYRAEVIIYKIDKKKKGLEVLKLYGSYTTTEWSICDMVWTKNDGLAAQTYRDGVNEASTNNAYEWFESSVLAKAQLNKVGIGGTPRLRWTK